MWRCSVFPVHHAAGRPVRVALCSGGHGPLLHQWHGSPGAPGSHTGPFHHIHVLDCGTFIWVLPSMYVDPVVRHYLQTMGMMTFKDTERVFFFYCFSGFCALSHTSVQDVEGDRPEGAAADLLTRPHHSQPIHPVQKYTLQSHQQRDYGVDYFLLHEKYPVEFQGQSLRTL